MTIGRIDINEKDLPKICGAVIQLEERTEEIEDEIAAIESASAAIAGSSPGGRLTLQTLTPVMITTQSAKTTIYYTPYNGSTVPIYTGTGFAGTAFSELSAATTDTTKSPAAIGASKVNDWFVWSDSGTLRLGHGPDWTSDTVRSAGTALVMVNGILLNNASITNGPAASRGTYVGTTRSNASSQLDWIVGGADVPGFFGVWNIYNRKTVAASTSLSLSSYTYSVATWRSPVGPSGISVRHSFVSGIAEDGIVAHFVQNILPFAGSFARIGIGLDTTSTPIVQATAGSGNSVGVSCAHAPQIGFHYTAALEIGDGVNNATFFGAVNESFSFIWQA